MNIDIEGEILPWVTDPSNVLALVNHPHNEQLLSGSDGFSFFDTNTGRHVRLRGLLAPLAEIFWPEELFPAHVRHGGATATAHRARKQPHQRKRRVPDPFAAAKSRQRFRQLMERASQAPAAATSAPDSTTSTKRSRAQEATRGLLRGSIVHQQIEDLVLLDPTLFRRKYKQGVHSWSFNALRALVDPEQQHHTELPENRPFLAELGVAALELGIATRIDLVSAAKDGRILWVEVKAGYDSPEEWEGATGWMRGVLHGVLANSAKNRAIVQVIVGALMAVRSRGIRGSFECWVLHVCSKGTEFIKVEPSFVARYGMLIYQAIWEHQRARRKEAKTRTKRRTQKTN